ncbi:MAG TPA: bifunctional phosphopantothenoylcysteine decarboxylase/phosphopantothenate--cysteine ligase CoaBC, partial [Clostridia bacterium]|nr:bifunctional phosphopantothenoylcysteine decarboxylase/phosphopantothenate--cysteine ligase CoaBC [Clostridia bacterium]
EWVGKKVMVTAGGTRENIDPVRYIGNRSSGKMGFALAKAAWLRGAETVLISGPTELEPPPGILYCQVESAGEMRQAVLEHYPETDVVIKAAAVADYRSDQMSLHKIKKDSEYSTLKLVRTPDILQELGEKKTGQILVGFAAETENLLTHARQKLTKKKLDLIVANDVTREDAGFGSDTNVVTLLFPDGKVQQLPLMSKEEVAQQILSAVENMPRFKKQPSRAEDKE